MKHMQKFTAAAMAVLLLGFTVVPAFAETAPSAKEEVIYAMADASGKVTDAEAVNIFAGGDIVDYGDYSAVKPLNTNDTITQNGDQIAFSSTADKVYYQGTMKNAALPWNISIRYYLDGKEYAPQDVAGKSGALEIRFSVTKNESCGGSFYDDYALQASFTLDTERCRNIVSNGATVANVGSDKQLTYTILPGKGIDTVITADVTDFEMDAAAINGVRLNLDVDVDDTDLMDKVDELVSAIGDLDDGAWELHDGTEELYDATKTLNSKVGDLHSGVGDLTAGAGDLYTGLTDITAQNQQADQLYLGYVKSQADSIYLAYVTTQADALYAQVAAQAVREQLIQSGYSEAQADAYLQTADGQTLVAQTVSNMTEEQKAQILNAAVAKLTDEQKKQILQGAVASLTEEQKAEIREAYIQQMMASDDMTSQINAAVATVSAAKQVSELKGQLDSYGVFYQGLVAYTDAVSSAAAGAKSLKLNMDTLYSNTGKLKLSVGELSDAVGELYDGTGELTDGTTEFVDKTSDMDTQISDEIDSMTASLSGGDGDAESFVSEKNTNVNTVQFVIKTAAIEKAETTTDNTVESAPLTFWQKLLRLVGLYA
jgi:putative membrane protein